MTYPPAPWTLQGYGLQTLQLVDLNLARSFVPAELEIVSLLPGKTLGSVYLSCYQAGSFLQYNELIVVPAYVRYQNKVGGWISHIYVDNPDSVAGGREIWGLPKEMAEFSWTAQGVTVTQNSQLLCQVTCSKISWKTWVLPKISAYGFGKIADNYLYFQTDFKTSIAPVKAQLKIPPESPFASLKIDKPLLTFALPELQIVAGKPEIIVNQQPVEV